MTIDSKTVVAQTTPEKLYDFLCDFNNLSRMLSVGPVQGLSSTADRCSFSVNGFMQITLTYIERTPYSRVVIGPATDSMSNMPFKCRIVLGANGLDSTQLNIQFEMEGGNPMMTMMLKPKLREAADKMAEQLAYFGNAL